jgi:hypothetical protein
MDVIKIFMEEHTDKGINLASIAHTPTSIKKSKVWSRSSNMEKTSFPSISRQPAFQPPLPPYGRDINIFIKVGPVSSGMAVNPTIEWKSCPCQLFFFKTIDISHLSREGGVYRCCWKERRMLFYIYPAARPV